MTSRSVVFLLLFLPSLFACNRHKNDCEIVVPSPDMKYHVYFNLNEGEPWYLFFLEKDIVIDWSLLGVEFTDHTKFSQGLNVVRTYARSVSSEDEILFAQGSILRSPFNEMVVELKKPENPGIVFKIILRAYNMGFAIGYEFEPISKTPAILEENTEINFYSKSTTWEAIMQDTTGTPVTTSLNENFPVPCVFQSDKGFRVEVNQPAEDDHTKTGLIRNNQMNYSYKYLINQKSRELDAKTLTRVPFKIFLVSKN